MSFFIRKLRKQSGGSAGDRSSPQWKKKKTDQHKSPGSTPKKSRFSLADRDDEIPSDSDSEHGDVVDSHDSEPQISSDEEETAQNKRLRLAKKYLADLEAQEAGAGQEQDETSATIAERLKHDILEQAGRLHKLVANDYIAPESDEIKVCRGHQLSVTCVVVSPDDRHIFSGSKDCSIIKWSVETGKKVKVIPGGRKGSEDRHVGHTSVVYCLAISTDNKFLTSGDKNKLILVWNPETCSLLHKFTGHRDVVSGLAFRRGSHQLFSSSHDRTVKIWNLDEMSYVETLFGHLDVVTGIDSLTRERVVTSGGRDRSVRVWKIIEESQLIFHGHSGSIDAISLIDEEHFVTGADDNSLALWSVFKKKPLALQSKAHSETPEIGAKTDADGNWISSIASLRHTDLVASGSKDGFIRLWQISENFQSLTNIMTIPVVGFINSLKFSNNGDFLVAGVGQEHRLGRWWRVQPARNSICIIPLKKANTGATKTLPSVPSQRKTNSRGRRGRRRWNLIC